ncbi:MAG: hypothetical protein C0582_05365 [Alphaproteobacteria bacterium]|nr:MAG: hypothetical protein C0582_05365 [Alphaproteobacteria bacterium]
MANLFQDPAFWYAVSFALFAAVAGRRVVKLVQGMVQSYRQSILDDLQEAQALKAEAHRVHAQIQHEIAHWPDEEKTKRRRQHQQIKDLKIAYEEGYQKLLHQKTQGNESYIQAKEVESRKRLESLISEEIITKVRHDILT